MKFMFMVLLLLTLLVQWCKAQEDQEPKMEGGGPGKEQVYKLFDHLFTAGFAGGLDYNREVRPVTDGNNALDVYMRFHLLSLIEVNAKEQKLGTNVRLIFAWTDQLLSWNQSIFYDIETMLVKQERIWLPDVIVSNSVTKQQQLGYDDLPIRLTDKGVIIWEPTIITSTSCDIDVTYYPFDTQKCSIEFQTAISRSEEIVINVAGSDSISLEYFSKDGSWEIIDSTAENLEDSDEKSKIRFTFLLRRRRTFFIVNIIAPVLFLSLTASLVFALPADSGEKMGTGITVLLAYAVYLTIVTDHLPSTSLQVSILALYLTLLLGVTAVSVVCAVFLLRVHHKPDTHLVGPRITKMILFLRWFTCTQRPGDKEARKNRNAVTPTLEDNAIDLTDPKVRDDSLSEIDHHPPIYVEPMTWSLVAKTLDWFLFYIFTSVTVFFTLGFLLSLIIGSEVDRPSL